MVGAGVGLLAAVLTAFVLLGSSSNPTVDPIAQAATVSSHAPGFRMHLSMSLTSPAFPGAITGYGDAVVDPRDHAASTSFGLDLSSLPQVAQAVGGTTMSLNMIVDGQTAYVKLPHALLRAMPTLGAKPWLKLSAAKAAGATGASSLGNDLSSSNPGQLLKYLSAASSGVTNEGEQRIDGVQTTHYHAGLSLDRLAAGLPATGQAATAQALSKLRQSLGGTDLPVDVWIDAHQLIRRMAISMAIHAAGTPSIQLTIAADLSDYRTQPRPAVPPADQVQDASSLLSGVRLAG